MKNIAMEIRFLLLIIAAVFAAVPAGVPLLLGGRAVRGQQAQAAVDAQRALAPVLGGELRVLREAQISNIVIYSVGLSETSASMRAPAKQTASPTGTPPGTFGGPSFPGTAQTPTSQQQYGGNIDLLGLAEWAVRNATAVVKDRPLEVAATATGGTYESVFRDTKIENAIDAIGGELNSQYMLSYHPTSADHAGYHQIKVTVDRPGVKVRTRPGYYLEAK